MVEKVVGRGRKCFFPRGKYMDMAREGLPVAGKQIWEVFEGEERSEG